MTPRTTTAAPAAEVNDARQRLQSKSGDGSLGPLMTQKAAAYLGMPVRCETGEELHRSIDGPLYVSQTQGMRIWFWMDAMLASTLADAMIGGDGDPSRVGYGTTVAHLAQHVATVLIGTLATALELRDPGPAKLVTAPDKPLVASCAGSLSLAGRAYGWQSGVNELADERPVLTRETTIQPVKEQLPPDVGTREVSWYAGALERAERQLSEILRTPVRFNTVQAVTTDAPRMPQGWLRLSLGSRGGGAIVLSIDRQTAAALVSTVLGGDAIVPESGGMLVEAGAEAVARAALHAFAAALTATPDELHNIERLGDDAMLAQSPHESIEHSAAFGPNSGVFRWLVPARMRPVRTPGAATRGSR